MFVGAKGRTKEKQRKDDTQFVMLVFQKKDI